MRFPRLVLAALLTSLTVSGAAFAANPPPAAACHDATAPSNERLPVAPPTVKITSYDARVTANVPARRVDPMAIRTTNVQPGTTLMLMRQKQSHDAEIPKCVGECSILKSVASNAAHYVSVREVKPQVVSPGDVHVDTVTDAKQVLWPGTRYLVKGVTRDGEALPHATGVVVGMNAQNETVFNHTTESMQNQRVSGDYLKSARAWVKAGNLFVSEPMRDKGKIDEGNRLVAEAESKQKVVAEKQALVAVELEAQKKGDTSAQARINTLNQEINKLSGEATTAKQQGDQLRSQGEISRVKVVSVAAMPAQANFTHTNPRLAGTPNAQMHTATGVSDAYDGYSVAEVAGIHQDTIRTTLSFPAVPNANVGSSRTITFQVPKHDAEPAFEMDGRKYYRVTPTTEEQVNDPPRQ